MKMKRRLGLVRIFRSAQEAISDCGCPSPDGGTSSDEPNHPAASAFSAAILEQDDSANRRVAFSDAGTTTRVPYSDEDRMR